MIRVEDCYSGGLLRPELVFTAAIVEVTRGLGESRSFEDLVDRCDAIQLLARAAWHSNPKRKLHPRVRGQNVHVPYFTWDDLVNFLDSSFERQARFGGL